MVSQWKNSEEKFNNVISGNLHIGARRVSFYLAAEEELIKWFNELRRMGIAVTAVCIRLMRKVPKQFKLEQLKMTKTSLSVFWQLQQVETNYPMVIFKGIRISPNLPCGIIVHMHESAWMDENLILICQWILEAWDDISAEMIIKSFKKCGISNKLDGTEDNLLYDSDKENSEIDNNKDLTKIVEEDSLSANELEE
ncbi:21354_t:CDS:2 [Gigaspora margarita]|uniref:21354_t:CDS:1 n=1 Tax=Gigaspora margarita TaxID=4874 RepID=A0ABN7UFC7_GIGMA|nr:21354_t:CDS:2 [Gigaspora margarita]